MNEIPSYNFINYKFSVNTKYSCPVRMSCVCQTQNVITLSDDDFK